MNRRELAKTLQAQLLYDGDPNDPVFSSFNFADETLQLIFGLIKQKLVAGEDVAIRGFGQWRVRETPGGMRRNPTHDGLPGRRPRLGRQPGQRQGTQHQGLAGATQGSATARARPRIGRAAQAVKMEATMPDS